MKRIFLLAIIILASTCSMLAKDFNSQQLALRLEIVKFLSSEGFQPKIDTDGDVTFTKSDVNYYIIINENWNEPYLITLYQEYAYDDKNYTRTNLENCISLVAQYKVVKLYCRESSYTYRADVFCENANVLKTSFYSLIKQFEAVRKNIAAALTAGLGGVDIANNREAAFDKAVAYYRNDEYNMSFPLFKYLSETGCAKAYGYMGLAYEYGDGTLKNEDLMIENYRKAIENGYYWCAYCLGNYYYSNENYAEAMNYFNKCGANENGFRSEALYLMGKMHENGEGIAKNLSQAVLCYKKSVEHATELECDARLALMRMGETIERKEDFIDATKTMLMGLSMKEMYDIGEEYELGLNNRVVSLIKAYAYYKAAADGGYTKAECKMGEIYISNYYPFNDKSKSDKYYQKALKDYKKKVKTNGDACHELGYMYYNGYGVEKDMEQAKYYYKSGALLGDKNAAWRLGLIYKNEMEYAEAYKFLLKAAEDGQGMAMYELAKLYEDGLGISYNREKAIEWYKKCSSSSYKAKTDAKAALKRLGLNDEKE